MSLTIDPDEVIQKKGLGVVVNDIERMIVAMKKLLASPSLRDEMALKAIKHAQTVHSESAVMENINARKKRKIHLTVTL